MKKQEMSYWVRVLVPTAIFFGTQIALNHSPDLRVQRFMNQYWFLRHWYSPEFLSSMFFLFAATFYARHHRRLMASKVG